MEAAESIVLPLPSPPTTETRTSVVELGHPWKCVKVRRKLPPLKYYYDLDMGMGCINASTMLWDILSCVGKPQSQVTPFHCPPEFLCAGEKNICTKIKKKLC